MVVVLDGTTIDVSMDDRLGAILFDNDGILVDTEHLYFQANVAVFQKVGFALTEAMYEELYLRQNVGAWQLVAESGVPEADFEGMRTERNAIYADLLRSEELLIPGVLDIVRGLADTFRLGVVTSSRRDHFDLIHERTGLLPYFDFVVAEGDYLRSKPDPEPYLAGIRRSGFDRSRCLAIEDSARGLAAAKSAGLACWVVPSRLTRGQDFTAADRILPSLAALPLMVR
jgi:HAD superfamily hydrolase (TIGR01509 family)